RWNTTCFASCVPLPPHAGEAARRAEGGSFFRSKARKRKAPPSGLRPPSPAARGDGKARASLSRRAGKRKSAASLPSLHAERSTLLQRAQRLAQQRAERGRVAAPQVHARRGMPAGAGLHGTRDAVRQRGAWPDALLQEQCLDLEYTLAAMRLGIEPADDAAAIEDRQHVVAMAAFRRRQVAFDAVLE